MISPEKPLPSDRIIRLGEGFLPFDSRYLHLENTDDPTPLRCISPMILQTGILPPFATGLMLLDGSGATNDSITPLNPDITYIFTPDDVNEELRAKKLWSIPFDKKRIVEEAPLVLLISFAKFRASLPRNTSGDTIENLFSRLRVQLDFPESSYEGRLHDEEVSAARKGDTLAPMLRYFHPVDLPNLLPNAHHSLRLPLDTMKLSQIRGKFFLAREGLEVDFRKGLDPGSFIPPRLKEK